MVETASIALIFFMNYPFKSFICNSVSFLSSQLRASPSRCHTFDVHQFAGVAGENMCVKNSRIDFAAVKVGRSPIIFGCDRQYLSTCLQ